MITQVFEYKDREWQKKKKLKNYKKKIAYQDKKYTQKVKK